MSEPQFERIIFQSAETRETMMVGLYLPRHRLLFKKVFLLYRQKNGYTWC